MTDGELVRQTLAGNTQAYEELVRRFSARTLAFCHAKVRSADTADELAQETLLRGFRALATLNDPEKFGLWLRGIATRVCLDWLKARQSQQITFNALAAGNNPEEFLAVAGNGPMEAAEQADDVRQLLRAVEALPEELRDVLMLYYYQDATYRDLAEQLGVSTATINARLTRARAMLRERLTGQPATGSASEPSLPQSAPARR